MVNTLENTLIEAARKENELLELYFETYEFEWLNEARKWHRRFLELVDIYDSNRPR